MMTNFIVTGFLMLLLFIPVPAWAEWIKRDSGTLAWLRAVYFVDHDKGWASGSNGTLLKTEDGGVSWRKVKKFTEDTIRDVYFYDSMRGWLLCERNVYASRGAVPSYLLETADGGNSWKSVDFAAAPERVARVFSAPDRGKYFAVGENGAFWSRPSEREAWKKSELPVRFLMLDGYFFDHARGVIVGGGGTVLWTDNGGASWNPGLLEDGARTKFNAVCFIDPETGWLAGLEGRIYQTRTGGRRWTAQASATTADLTDVAFADARNGVAVGDGGVVRQTTDGGLTWKEAASGTRNKLEKVVYAGTKIVAVGYGGTIIERDRGK